LRHDVGLRPGPQGLLRRSRGCRSTRLCLQSGADAFAKFDNCAGSRELDDAARDRVAHFVLGDVLVDAGGDQLLHGELDLALFGIDSQNQGLDALAFAHHVARMVDAAVGDDLADVHEAVDTLGDLNESAEVHDLGDGAFDLRAGGKLALDFEPGIGERLLEAERDAALLSARGGLDGENDGVDAVALRSRSEGWRTFLAHDISEM
jgi:hypothetical protein